MNNYRVEISAGNTFVPYLEVCATTGISDKEKRGGVLEFQDRDTFAHGGVAYCRRFNYATVHEELALSVYAKAKRNLDLSKYSVTLELPGKGEQ